MPVERKYERDIDLLLAEELQVNPAFADWLKNRTPIADKPARVIDVWVSRADNLGESDLIAIYELGNSERFALMIEDKVNAPLQPDQANRYRKRARRYIDKGHCSGYALILCAPRFYLEHSRGAQDFDGLLAFEEISDFLAQSDPSARGRYRADFLRTAATRRVNNWTREVDKATDQFWEAAYRLATKEFPILEMKRLAVTKNSLWIKIRPSDMPTMPRHIYIYVKADRGYMDLTFSSVNAALFSKSVRRLLQPDMTVPKTGASAAIRLEVEPIAIRNGVKANIPRLRKAFEACERLVRFYRTNRALLDRFAEQAGS